MRCDGEGVRCDGEGVRCDGVRCDGDLLSPPPQSCSRAVLVSGRS